MVRHVGLRDFQAFLHDNYKLTAEDASVLSISINCECHAAA